MLAALAALAIGAGPAERDYRLTVRDAPGTRIALHAQMPEGWIAAFCTPKVCAPGHVVVTVSPRGSDTIALHVYRTDDRALHRARIVLTSDKGAMLPLDVTIR